MSFAPDMTEILARARADLRMGVAVVLTGRAGAVLVLRKKEFLDRIHAETGARKKDVREIADATLKILGEALGRGEALALSPLGKIRVNRQVGKAEAETLIVKIRRDGAKPAKKVEQTAEEGLAEAEE